MSSEGAKMVCAGELGNSNAHGRIGSAAARFADAILIAAVLFFAIALGFAFQLHRHLVFKAAFASLLFLAAAVRWRGRPTARINAVLILTPVIGGLLAYETYGAWRRPADGTVAWLAGREFDSRGLLETLEAERRNDPSTVSYVIPRAMLTHHLVLEHWEPEAVVRTVAKDWGIAVDGTRMLPLSGLSNRRTVFCNESGTRIIYESDEHGFNNPRGIWGSHVQVAILGDSFSHGACVAPEATTAAHIRKRFPNTLSLGMSANGPMMEYAGLKEYVADQRPSTVLWVYYLNDLSDLEVEKKAAVLWRYLDDDGFRQGLAKKQESIDRELEFYVRDLERRAPPRWPASLAGVGLTRATTPLWVQDLITGDHHSSLAAFIRLDNSIWIVNQRLLEERIFEEPADYPLFERILGKARDVVASWGGQLYFVYLPALHHLEPRHRFIASREPVLALVHGLGIPVIDVHRVFLEQPDPERLRFHYGSHANEAGYELHAKTILAVLESPAPRVAAGDVTRLP